MPNAHSDHASRLLMEYHKMCEGDRIIQLDNSVRWNEVEDSIRYMPLEEQMKYADYVTTEICKLDEEVVLSFISDFLAWESLCCPLEARSMGNIALVVHTMNERFPKLDATKKATKLFQDYLDQLKYNDRVAKVKYYTFVGAIVLAAAFTVSNIFDAITLYRKK